jgi:HAMP domain-containing protein
MIRGTRYSLQGLLLTALVPTLVATTLIVAITAYQEMRSSIIAGFDAKLTAVGTIVSSLIDPVEHATLLAAVRAGQPGEEIENGELFQKTVAPLRQIKKELGLTYLYTQVPMGGLDIIYVLDANTDDNHSPPGTVDSLPAADAGNILAVLDTGQPHITDIQQWKQWGLIKTAFVPLPATDGHSEGMVGADVDITTINGQLRVALVSAGLIGVCVLLVSLAVAVPAARRIADPLAAMKLAGFRLAAGETAVSVVPQGATELRDLAQAFNNMRGQVQQEMALADAAERRTEWGRRTNALLRLLNDRPPAITPQVTPGDPLLDGGISFPDGAIAWLTLKGQEPLRARIRHLQVQHLAGAAGSLQQAETMLSSLLGHDLLCLFRVESHRVTVHSQIGLTLADGTVLAPGTCILPLLSEQPLTVMGDGRRMTFVPNHGGAG